MVTALFNSLGTVFNPFWIALEAGFLLLSAYITVRFHQSVWASILAAPRLMPVQGQPSALPSVAVVIPAYNEALNLRDCVVSVLHSQLPNLQQLQVWIADDESTDATGAIAQSLVAQDNRVHWIAVPPRPTERVWRGKNWACAQAVVHAQGDYLLFIDADVRLEPGAIAAALTTAQALQADLLSTLPEVVCECLAEWLAQPLILRVLTAGFNVGAVNDPKQPAIAFAAGPFMLFRRSAYDAIGGHRAVAEDLVEDVALARRIKAAGLKLHLALGLGLIKVRMYRDLAALWEGWTKNLHMGAQRQVSATLLIALIALAVRTVPWLGIAINGILWASCGFQPDPALLLGLCLSVILLVWASVLWRRQADWLALPVRYEALGWLGGLLVAAIALGSILKTETGWGWTWRGRSLAAPSHVKANPVP